MVFEGYTADDNMTRLLSAVVSGTVFLDGDDLHRVSTGQALARAYLTNGRINDVARLGQAFRPVEGNTGTAPSNVFVLQDGARYYLAVLTSARVRPPRRSTSRAPGSTARRLIGDGPVERGRLVSGPGRSASRSMQASGTVRASVK